MRCREESEEFLLLHGYVHVLNVGFGLPFIFSAGRQLDTWTPAPQKARGMA